MTEFENLASAKKFIERHEIELGYKYITFKSSKNFGGKDFTSAAKVIWNDRVNVKYGRQEFTGIPFVILGQRVLDCQFGKDRHAKRTEGRKNKSNDDHHKKRKKREVQESKKVDCPAKIVMREICRFPSYQVSKNAPEFDRMTRAEELLVHLRNGEDVNEEHVIVVCLPDADDHTCDLVENEVDTFITDSPDEENEVETPDTLYSEIQKIRDEYKNDKKYDMSELVPSQVNKEKRKMLIDPPPFSSIEEAKEFLKNHEIATNNRYVINKSRTFTTAGLSTRKFGATNIRWDKPETTDKVYDGIPYAVCGSRTYYCQYGVDYRASRQKKKMEDPSKKPRKSRNSKKVNCPAYVKMTLIVKFPEYAVETLDGKEKKLMRKQFVRDIEIDNPQRFVQVYVKICKDHHHMTESLLLNNTPSRITQSHIESMSAVVLKPGATLRGKSLHAVNTQFTITHDMPDRFAQPTYDRSLLEMSLEELLDLFWDITGVSPDSIFMEAQKKFNIENMRFLVHLCIVFANAESETDGNFVAHRSIRIAGEENNIELVTCFDTSCYVEEPHIHCPLCPKHKLYKRTEDFKSHYVKSHISTAIECAGLMILRCLDECIMRGCMKDVKAFNSGHWHCWKCDSGYERKQQLIQHYQSHLQDIAKDCTEVKSVLITKSMHPDIDSGVVPFYLNSSNMNVVYHQKATPNKVKKNKPPKRKYNHDDDDDNDSDEDDDNDDSDNNDAMYDPRVNKNDTRTMQNNYEQPIVYVPGENEPVIYGQERENGEIVLKLHDGNTSAYLNDRFIEIQKRCAELERINVKQKSLIETLNKKIEKLESKLGITGTICSKCFNTVEENNHQNQVQKNLLQSLKDLKSSHTYPAKKLELRNDHLSFVAEGLHEIDKEIKKLKDIAGISKKQFEILKITTKDGKLTSLECGDMIDNEEAKSSDYVPETSKKSYDETVYEEINDVSMFGKTFEVKRKRKVIEFPLPDNAVEIVKNCVDKTGRNQRDQCTQVSYKRQRTAINDDISYTPGVNNGEVMQTDISNDYQVVCDRTSEMGTEINRVNVSSDHQYVQLVQPKCAGATRLPITVVNSENGEEYVVYTTDDITNSTIAILPSNECSDNNNETMDCDNTPVSHMEVSDSVPMYTATKLVDTGGNVSSENSTSSSNNVCTSQESREVTIKVLKTTTYDNKTIYRNLSKVNPSDGVGESQEATQKSFTVTGPQGASQKSPKLIGSQGATHKSPKLIGSQGATHKSPKFAEPQGSTQISPKFSGPQRSTQKSTKSAHPQGLTQKLDGSQSESETLDNISVPAINTPNINESVSVQNNSVQNNELTTNPSCGNKIVGSDEVSNTPKAKVVKIVKRLNPRTSSRFVCMVKD